MPIRVTNQDVKLAGKPRQELCKRFTRNRLTRENRQSADLMYYFRNRDKSGIYSPCKKRLAYTLRKRGDSRVAILTGNPLRDSVVRAGLANGYVVQSVSTLPSHFNVSYLLQFKIVAGSMRRDRDR